MPRRTALVVEDEPLVRRFVKSTLEGAGYEVVEAENGSEAFQLVEARPDLFDVIISDLLMPALTGTVLLSRLRKAFPRLRMILMTGYTDELPSDVDVLVLRKPFSPTALLAAVASLVT